MKLNELLKNPRQLCNDSHCTSPAHSWHEPINRTDWLDLEYDLAVAELTNTVDQFKYKLHNYLDSLSISSLNMADESEGQLDFDLLVDTRETLRERLLWLQRNKTSSRVHAELIEEIKEMLR